MVTLKECKGCYHYHGITKDSDMPWEYVDCGRSLGRVGINSTDEVRCPVDKVTRKTKYYTNQCY